MIRTLCLTLSMAIACTALSVAPAFAQDTSLESQKAEWQDRYRKLLLDKSRLEYTIRISRENYTRAKRRNYPRGGALQQYMLDADQAEKELAEVEARIQSLRMDARRQAIPPNWLYQVEDEGVSYTPPASATDDEVDDSDDDRAGRNPLYLKDDDER